MCRWNSVVGSGLAFCVKQVLKRKLFDLPNWSAFLVSSSEPIEKRPSSWFRLYAFFPALSQWWGYVYLHCVFIGSLNFSLSYDWPLLPGLKWFFCAQFNTEELLPLLVETKHLVQKRERNTGSKITSCDINVPAVMSCTRIVISQEDIVEPVWYNTFCVH